MSKSENKTTAIKRIIENLFLGFLLLFGFLNLFLPPVDTDDELTGVLFFVAFGICRLAKEKAYKEAL